MLQALVAGLVVMPLAWLVLRPAWTSASSNRSNSSPSSLLVALFSACGGLALGCSINQQHIGLMFSMVITPMIFFGCTYYPWSALNTFPDPAESRPDQSAGLCQRRIARHAGAAVSAPVDRRDLADAIDL